MLNCLICDDHAMMLHAISSVISSSWPQTRISQARDFPTAWQAARSQPDLILTDLAMPGADPVTGVAALQEAAPQSPIIVVTANEDDEVLITLFGMGILGFIPKSATVEVMEAAIRLVLAGGSYVPPRVVALAGARIGEAGAARHALQENIARLTDRQIAVLSLIAQGAQNKEIARDMALSPATVKAHVAAIISALEVNNRTEAAFRARELGLI
jgi:two-component system, NarL family, nitrate/nitrite response regulator NarL